MMPTVPMTVTSTAEIKVDAGSVPISVADPPTVSMTVPPPAPAIRNLLRRRGSTRFDAVYSSKRRGRSRCCDEANF